MGHRRAGFRPLVDRTFSITEAAAAHRYLEAETNTGRVILTTTDDDWPTIPFRTEM